MGYYKIEIKGLGSHHNKDNKADADKMAFQFVDDLKTSGHQILEATFSKVSPSDVDDLLKIGGSLTHRDLPKGGKPTALTLEQVREIEMDKSFGETFKTQWTNENFKKLIDTVKVLYAELNIDKDV